MNVTHVVSTFSPEHGGPTQEIGNHCEAQFDMGYNVTLYNLGGFPGTSAPRRLKTGVVQREFCVSWPPSLGFSATLLRELKRGREPDIYHVHGVWHLAQITACWDAQRKDRPYLYHLMGGFTAYELGRKKLKKAVARRLYQDSAMHRAGCLHVNGETEAIFLREMGFRNHIVVLPVGVALHHERMVPDQETVSLLPKLRDRRILLYLARLHPTKGIETLVDAWKRVSSDFPDWVLVVAGSGEKSYVTKILEKVAATGLADAMLFAGQLTEGQKNWWYQHASLYVLPSFQENFGNTVAEALGFGVPVITTTHTPWGELVAEKCGWLSEPTGKDLAATLRTALASTSVELAGMGAIGKGLVERKYSLRSVLSRVDCVYRWLLGGEEPAFLWRG